MNDCHKNLLQFVISIMVLVGTYVMIYALFTINVPESNKEIIVSIASSMMTCFIGVIGYWIGNSKANKDREDMLFNSTPIVKEEKERKDE